MAGAVLLGSGAAFADDNQGTPMTAGLVMKEMPTGERTAYIMGIVEGMAYARFRKDTLAAGQKTEQGMKCIYGWLYTDSMATLDRIERVFEANAQHYPSVLLAALIKKECGE